MKDTDRIWVLMGRELSHAITFEEQQELRELLSAEPELWYSYELIQAVNNLDDVTQEYVQEIRSLLDGRIAPEKLNAMLEQKLEETVDEETPPPVPKYRVLLQFAAAFAGVAILTWGGWSIFRNASKNKVPDTAMSEIVAPKGSKTQITLMDGTAIWLNAGSKLTYPKNFSLENREVYLTGEAYFKVAHNDAHPFIVHTAETDIRDLGTTFNVKAYAGSATTEATLIEGTIEVSMKKDPARKIRMAPGEKLVFHNNRSPEENEQEKMAQVFEVSEIVPYAKTNDIVETAWVENKLIFRSERFADLAAMMERRYNISILIKNEEIKAYRLTGIFKNENVTEALKLLQVIAPFKFDIHNGQVIIDKEK